MSMEKHVTLMCKSAFYHLRNLSKIRKYLTRESVETLVPAFVASRIDYCNALFSVWFAKTCASKAPVCTECRGKTCLYVRKIWSNFAGFLKLICIGCLSKSLWILEFYYEHTRLSSFLFDWPPQVYDHGKCLRSKSEIWTGELWTRSFFCFRPHNVEFPTGSHKTSKFERQFQISFKTSPF